jgi:hypothetical protein
MGEEYALVTMAEVKCPNCWLVLSGVLRRSDVSWRRIGALNDRFDWIARAHGRGKRRLGHLYARVSELDVEYYTVYIV